jgi:hypothetical protein
VCEKWLNITGPILLSHPPSPPPRDIKKKVKGEAIPATGHEGS